MTARMIRKMQVAAYSAEVVGVQNLEKSDVVDEKKNVIAIEESSISPIPPMAIPVDMFDISILDSMSFAIEDSNVQSFED